MKKEEKKSFPAVPVESPTPSTKKKNFLEFFGFRSPRAKKDESSKMSSYEDAA